MSRPYPFPDVLPVRAEMRAEMEHVDAEIARLQKERARILRTTPCLCGSARNEHRHRGCPWTALPMLDAEGEARWLRDWHEPQRREVLGVVAGRSLRIGEATRTAAGTYTAEAFGPPGPLRKVHHLGEYAEVGKACDAIRTHVADAETYAEVSR